VLFFRSVTVTCRTHPLGFDEDGVSRALPKVHLFSGGPQCVDETHPIVPVNLYGSMKATAERIVTAYLHSSNTAYTIIGPSAVYGPRNLNGSVVQAFIEDASKGTPLSVKGEERIDFTYVEDLVRGIALAIEKPAARDEIFNMTAGQARSLDDLSQVLSQHFPGAQICKILAEQGRPRRGALNVAKAKELLGYSPSRDLERGVLEYVRWYRGLGLTASEVIRPSLLSAA
jgi:nucleoside-diphosphate-sugar epimerase